MSHSSSANRASFKWQDPLLLGSLLSQEERMIRDSAHQYYQEKLMPRKTNTKKN